MTLNARMGVPLRRFAVAGIAAWLLAEIVIVGGLAVRRGQVPLAWGLGGDALLLGGAGLWLAGREARARLKLKRVARLGLLACAMALLAAAAAGHLREVAGPVLGIAEVWIQAFVAIAIVRAVRSRGPVWLRARAALESILPVRVAAALLLELELLYGAGCALLRVGPPRRQPSETEFVPLVASHSGWVIPFVALASLVELPAVHLLLHSVWPGHDRIHLLLAFLQIYGLVWLIGDRWWMARTAHEIGSDVLRLRLGRRAEMDIPLATITRAIPLRDDRDRNGVRPRSGRHTKLTPWDPPNVHLCLESPVERRGMFGSRRKVSHLDLFVDRPEAFLERLTRSGARTSARTSPPSGSS